MTRKSQNRKDNVGTAENGKWGEKFKIFAAIAAMLTCVGLISIGYAFFSDNVNEPVVAKSGCLQITPTLRIDGETGDRMNAPLQTSATCIPSQYTQTDSIVLDNGPYLDTRIKGSSALKIVADAQFASATANNYYLFGSRDCSDTNCDTRAIIFGSSPGYAFYMNGYHTTANGNLSDGARHVFTYANGSLTVDGVLLSSVLSRAPSGAWSSNNNLYLGTFNNNGSPNERVKATVYNFQIYDGSTLVRQMIPVLNSKTGECGMFDTVSNSFFGNLGTGTIACVKPQVRNPNCDNLKCNGQNQGETGVIVQPNTIHQFSYTLANTGSVDYKNYTGDTIAGWLSSRYRPVDWIQFDGTNYIDTGVDQTSDALAITTDFQFTTLPTVSGAASFVFGSRQGPGLNSLAFYASTGAAFTALQYGAASANTTVGTATTASRCTLTINITSSSKNVSIANCGSPTSASFTAAAPTSPYSMYIGGINSGGGFATTQSFIGKIYSFAVTKSTQSASRDFVPAYDTVSGQCGLYDRISHLFFSKGGASSDLTPAKGSCVPPTDSPMRILLYPSTVSDATINAEIAAMAGGATTSPSALATLDGSTCASTFYGTDTGITPVCMTSVLVGTLGAQTNVGDNQTYTYKFVAWAPNNLSSVYSNTKVRFGVSSGAQGVIAQNWKQQVHPYIGTSTSVGSVPTIVDADKNKQPFVDQLANDAASIDTYLKALVTASDIEDGDLSSQVRIMNRGGFNPSAVGTYKITYKVTDSDGNVTSFSLDVQVWNFVKVVAGGAHSMALGSNGSVWSWGYNGDGQLGLGDTATQSKPTQIASLANIVDIAASYNASYAVAADGTVYSWGGNTYGEDGSGVGTNRSGAPGTASTIPRIITLPGLIGGEQAVKISANSYNAGVVTDQGNVYTWGFGDFGVAGQGYSINLLETDQLFAPYRNPFMSSVKEIAFGYYNGIAITTDGGIYTWGTNDEGELGAGVTDTVPNCHNASGSTTMVSGYWDCQPAFWSSLTDVVSVSAGLRTLSAVTSSGQVYSFGQNNYYNLGNGSTNTSLIVNTPTAISLANATQVVSSFGATAACTSSNQVYIWGTNSVGAFGNGSTTTTNFYVPTVVPLFPNCQSVALTQRSRVAGQQYVSLLALSADGTKVYSLGENQYGQLGNGTVTAAVTGVSTWAFTPAAIP